MRGDVERRCGRGGRGRCGRRHGCGHVLVMMLAGSGAGLVLAKYARNGERRVRRCGRLDGRRLAAASVGRGRGGSGRGAVTGGQVAAVVAAFVVVVVSGHVDARRLGHGDGAWQRMGVGRRERGPRTQQKRTATAVVRVPEVVTRQAASGSGVAGGRSAAHTCQTR